MMRQRGISLIELIMFIVIVSVALAGILLVMNTVTRGSADPLIHKQALAIAESMLEEVELMPFTFCDPDDANASTATAATGTCAVAANEEKIGVENDVSRYDLNFPLDNVSDYDGCQMNNGVNARCNPTGAVGVMDINNNVVVAAAGYRVAVAVTNNGMPLVGTSPAILATEALLIQVTVTGPDNVPVVVEGMRTRYSPRI